MNEDRIIPRLVNGIVIIVVLSIIWLIPTSLHSDFKDKSDTIASFALIVNLVLLVRPKLSTGIVSLLTSVITFLAFYYVITTIEHHDESGYYSFRMNFLLESNAEHSESFINFIGISNLISIVLLMISELALFVFLFLNVRRSHSKMA